MNPNEGYLVDFRCPACNRPVTGSDDVGSVLPPSQIDHCQYCHTAVAVTGGEEGLGRPLHYYEAQTT